MAKQGILGTDTEEGVSRVADGTNETMHFRLEKEKSKASDVIMQVYTAMEEKGYDPVNQIVGYLISGDPTYITSYNNARYLIRMLERDELLEELVRFYVEAHEGD
ncbi:MAG: IreB family regulatory phosphoprotein [Clostridia bacterium]|nr:IreB family regulatory phosphoprotein [Candidatus Pelethousia sp.]NCB30402.1 IreB family regulatory phosphoprotein [Clostridia bacterium]